MTSGSVEWHSARAPILALGLGNLLLSDDGVGLMILERLAAGAASGVDYVDGGTQGLSLMGDMEGRRAVLVCDAVGLGDPAGTVHLLEKEQVLGMRARRQGSAHEGNALELLEALLLIGSEPLELVVVGVEPEVVRTGIGLSPAVQLGLEEAVVRATAVLDRFRSGPRR